MTNNQQPSHRALDDLTDLARKEQPAQTLTITKVEGDDRGYTIHCGSTVFGLDKEYGVEPNVGDTVELWTSGYSFIRGMAVNDQVLFYTTAEQQQIEHAESVRLVRLQTQKDWANDVGGRRTKWEAERAALPQLFQDRIEKFRSQLPDWDSQYGGYEVMACTDAVKLGNHCFASPNPLEAWENSEGLDSEIGISKDHSGNSYGFMRHLAYHWITDPDMVVLEHGAMTPLTGCIDYGCPHPYFYGKYDQAKYDEAN